MSLESPLPNELVELTLNHLDVPSLLRCMQVCKLFHSIVSGSTHLVYKIELFESYMEDNERSSIDTVNRLTLLREYNHVWNSMGWTSSGFIPMSDGDRWKFSGGLLVQSTDDDELSLVQLPCKLKNIPERRWSVSFDFSIRAFALDNSQNLFVLLEMVESFPNVSYKIHLRTLSGEYHPRTSVTQITFASATLHADFSFLIQICGNHLGILFYDQFGPSSQNSFLVWNWRTGRQQLYIYTTQFRSFAFMTEDLILAAILKPVTGPALQVMRVAEYANPIHSPEDIPYVCELQYPRLLGDLEDYLIRAEPTPTWKPPPGSDVPFYGSRKDFIFTISMRIVSDDTQESIVLFVPLSTLLSEVERSLGVPRRNVPWDAWGPNGARMIFREPSDDWDCYTYGMKFIQCLPWKNGHMARVYDFNPYAARKHVKTSVDSPMPWTRLAKESRPISRCICFDRDVVTRLPGRVSTITVEHSDEGWDAAMIGENHIVMVQPAPGVYGYMAM